MSQNPRKSGWPEPAGELLQKMLRRRGLTEHVQGGRAIAVWAEAVGPAVAADTKAVSFRAGELKVWTREATHAHTLQRLSPKLLQALEGRLGGRVVRRIRFYSGPIEKSAPSGSAAPDGPDLTPERLAEVVLTPEQRDEIERMVATIPSDEVREWTRESLERHMRADSVRRTLGWTPCAACGTLIPPGYAEQLCGTCRVQGYGGHGAQCNVRPPEASDASEDRGGK